MTFDIRIIINTITCGLILLIFGLEEKKPRKVIIGGAFTVVGIILNTISVFNGA